jgi:hypothetical protein
VNPAPTLVQRDLIGPWSQSSALHRSAYRQ